MDATILRDLTLGEISLVDEGANQGAKVSLAKRRESNQSQQKGDDMSVKDLQKQNDQAPSNEGAEVNKELNELKKSQEVNNGLMENISKMTDEEKDAVSKMDLAGREALLKKLTNPEEVSKRKEENDKIVSLQKSLKDQAEQIAKMKSEKELETISKQLKPLGNVVDVVKFAPVFQKLKDVDSAAAESLEKQLKSVAEIAKDGAVFASIGKDGASGDAKTALEIAAKKLAEDDGISYEQAFAKLYKDNTNALTKAYKAEKKG